MSASSIGNKVFTLLPDGSKHNANELARMFDLPQASISRRARKYKKFEYTRDELLEWSRNLANGIYHWNRPASFSEPTKGKMDINDVVYQPSTLERSLLSL